MGKKAVCAVGAAVGVSVAMTTPASAYTVWSNNGCQYAGDGGQRDIDPQWASGTTWDYDYPSCSNVWVELHYRDAKGGEHVVESYREPIAGTMVAQIVVDGDNTYLYSCHSGRSASHGNWSIVRKLGSAPGSCGAP